MGQVTDISWANSLSDWTLNGSWVGGVAPLNDSVTNRVVFGNLATINAQPTLTTTASIAGLSINNTGADWSLLGTGMLRIGTSGFVVSGSGTTSVAPSVHVLRNQSWNVGSGAVLQTFGNLYGAATVTLTGAGTKQISGTNNMFHGTLVHGAGTLTIDNAQWSLRNAALMLNSSTTLVSSGGLWSGELSGGGAVNLGTSELRLFAFNNTTFSGYLTAGNIRVYGLGRQTLDGSTVDRLAGVSGDAVVYRGAELALAGNGTLTNAGNDVILKGGKLSISNASSANDRYLNAASNLSITGGGTFYYYTATGSNQTLASLSMGQGHAEIGVDTSGLNDPGLLAFTATGGLGSSGTINFYGQNLSNGRKLGITGSLDEPRITLGGQAATSFLGGYATAYHTDFAAYGASGAGVRAATAQDFSNVATNTNAQITGATIYDSTSTRALNSLKLDASASLSIPNTGGISLEGLLLTPAHTFTVRNTGGGTGNLAGPGGTMYFHVFDGSKLAVETNVAQGSSSIVKAGEGTLILTPRTTNTYGGLYINQGAVQAAPGTGLPNSAVVRLRGGVLEVAGGGTLNKTLGTSGGNINWQDTGGAGAGGFSAVGGALTVDLETAGASNLVWGQTRFVQTEYALLFGSQTSDSDVAFVDNLALNSGNQANYAVREVSVDGSSSTAWKATLSGIVSSVPFGGSTNGQYTDLMKTGTGTLELTGNNTYVGGTIVAEGALLVGHTNALGDASQSRAYVQVGSRITGARLYLDDALAVSRDFSIMSGGVGVMGLSAATTATYGGNIALGSDVTFSAVSGGSLHVDAMIYGGNDVNIGAGGDVHLAGVNQYVGVTTVTQGRLILDVDAPSGGNGALGNATTSVQFGPLSGTAPASLLAGQGITIARTILARSGTSATGTLTLGGIHASGTADFTGAVTLQRSVELTAALGGTTRFSGGLTGTGGITKVGAGLVLLNGTNTYTGATEVNAGTLEIGGSTSSAAATTVNGGALRVAFGGTFDSASTVTVAAGSSLVVDSGGTLSDSVTGAGTITINGTLNGAATVQSAATLGGSGRITGNISGAGLVSPGNSPGILDASQADPTSGVDFLFQFTQVNAAPNYLNRTSPGNDVLHLTHATTPFLAALTQANKIIIDFQVSALHVGDKFIGGFFTNRPGIDFYGDGTINQAQIEYLLNGVPLELTSGNWQFQMTTISQTGADFGSGYGGFTDGRIMEITITHVPEPSSMLLCAAAAGGAAWRIRRQRRRPATTA